MLASSMHFCALPMRPVLMGTVYDPTFGDDARHFLRIPPRIARAKFKRVNGVMATLAAKYGKLVDLHAHFLTGDPTWFVYTIEPIENYLSARQCEYVSNFPSPFGREPGGAERSGRDRARRVVMKSSIASWDRPK
jgi:hypothetical protein